MILEYPLGSHVITRAIKSRELSLGGGRTDAAGGEGGHSGSVRRAHCTFAGLEMKNAGPGLSPLTPGRPRGLSLLSPHWGYIIVARPRGTGKRKKQENEETKEMKWTGKCSSSIQSPSFQKPWWPQGLLTRQERPLRCPPTLLTYQSSAHTLLFGCVYGGTPLEPQVKYKKR